MCPLNSNHMSSYWSNYSSNWPGEPCLHSYHLHSSHRRSLGSFSVLYANVGSSGNSDNKKVIGKIRLTLYIKLISPTSSWSKTPRRHIHQMYTSSKIAKFIKYASIRKMTPYRSARAETPKRRHRTLIISSWMPTWAYEWKYAMSKSVQGGGFCSTRCSESATLGAPEAGALPGSCDLPRRALRRPRPLWGDRRLLFSGKAPPSWWW